MRRDVLTDADMMATLLGYDMRGVLLTNKSGAERSAGDVVVQDAANDSAFTTTTTEGNSKVLGVVAETIPSNALGFVQERGICDLEVDAATSRGQWLVTSATAGKATPKTQIQAGVFAVALTATAGAGTVTALLTMPSNISGGGDGGGPADASYLVLALHADLTAERVLVPGGGLTGTDSGPNADYTLAVGAGTLMSVGADSVGLANGSAQYQIIVTGATPFTPAYTALSAFAGAGLVFSGGVFAVGPGSGITVNADDVALTWGTPTISTIQPDDSANAGTSTNPARSDHKHAIVCDTPVNQAIGDSAAEGTSTGFARGDHKHGMPSFATPSVALGTAAAAGSLATLLRSDCTIVAFDATVPTTIQCDDAAATGSVNYTARRDHKHSIVCAAPSNVLVQTNAEGTSTSFARADHLHNVTTGTPGSITPDTTAAEGTATSLARSDHAHGITCAAPSANLTVATTNAEGSATSFARSDHSHGITSSANPGAAASILASDASGYLTLVRLKTDTIADKSGGNLSITPAGDIILNPTGDDVLAGAHRDINLGNLTTWFKAGYIDEVHAGTIKTVVFEAQQVNVFNSSFMVAKSSAALANAKTFAANGVADTFVANETGRFAVGDFLWLKDPADSTWLEVTGIASDPTINVTVRSGGGGAFDAGCPVVNFGPSGQGLMLHTAVDINIGAIGFYAPCIGLFSHTGTPWTTCTEYGRFGNIRGWGGFDTKKWGIGLGQYTANYPNFYVNATDGVMALRIYGTDYIKFDYNAGSPLAQIKGKLEIASGGGILIGSGTKDSNLTGWYLDNTEIVGQSGSGADQVCLTSDGKITAGGGNIVLNGAGLTVGGSSSTGYVTFRDLGGNIVGQTWGYESAGGDGIVILKASDVGGAANDLGIVELHAESATPTLAIWGLSNSNSATSAYLWWAGNTVFSIDRSGNVALSGTLDGVDVAALKTDVDGFPDELKNLTTAEIQQVENIGTVAISAGQWGYLGAMDQGVATGSNVKFAQVSGWLPFVTYEHMPANQGASPSHPFMVTIARSMVVKSLHIASYVATTNDASNYWTFALKKRDGTTITSVNTSGMAANDWVVLAVTGLSYSLTTTDDELYIQATKTGLPGNYYAAGPCVYVD